MTFSGPTDASIDFVVYVQSPPICTSPSYIVTFTHAIMAPVTITYTSHPAPSQPINQAIRSLRDQLPLRNLHWKPSTRTSLRTIQEIDVELVELGDVPTGGRNGLSSVLEQPLVNLCIVVCEVSTPRSGSPSRRQEDLCL
jgi:hypothetical protein